MMDMNCEAASATSTAAALVPISSGGATTAAVQPLHCQCAVARKRKVIKHKRFGKVRNSNFLKQRKLRQQNKKLARLHLLNRIHRRGKGTANGQPLKSSAITQTDIPGNDCLGDMQTLPQTGTDGVAPSQQPPLLDRGDLMELEVNEAESSSGSGTDMFNQEDNMLVDNVVELLEQLRYHTHQEDGISICPYFLSSLCWHASQCPQHHTVLPYHWQLRRKGTRWWESLRDDVSEMIERFYCDPNCNHVTLVIRGTCCTLNFADMSVTHWPGVHVPFDAARRLSTSSDPFNTIHFQYKYYWRDEGCWKEYNQQFLTAIVDALNKGQLEAQVSTVLHNYLISFSGGFQQNVATGKKRAIRLRPVFKARVVLMPYLRTLSGTPLPGNESKSTAVSHIPNPNSPYPETWTQFDNTQDFKRVALAVEDPAYRTVYQHFHKTMTESQYIILSIARVQNHFLWDKYKRKKEYMFRKMSPQEKLRNERHLFHGTSQCAIDAICKHNFDPRLSGKHATVYGQGSYFARYASYSHRYAQPSQNGEHYVFLSKVLVGKSVVGKPDMRRPPPVHLDNPTSDLYDSCVDKLTDPSIYVIFENDQCYPYFLIKYKPLLPTVNVD
ncbi:protein mono-ADP-ribosyltransferase TIPARP-like [Polypterus senegalus]|uniref:protein mono-ADP-ribosyltransferase TIPARP-like n=1 Tax=Polypterus senegalus TaxID=55291 RepID=UPI00196342FC|nr:protein mono-ADP-ribosyltransferase TIPARP-like [Polypterus senegalus]XP_039603038.1 protein mono-ADP-ribosyltransferase TIPARP-like [Polypterus senegalus]